jgi:hypothetical protein
MPMPGREEVPEEAVELYREAGQGASVFEDDTDPDYIDLISDAAVASAVPAIRNQERQRIQEALKQPIHDLATHIGRARMEIADVDDPPCVVAAASELKAVAGAMGDLRAALVDTLDPSGEAECDSCASVPGGEDHPERCPKSKKSCGHHCNHSWSHEHCHWCGKEWGEASVDPSKEVQGDGA